VLAKKRDGDEVGTPETLRWSEMELSELDLSLDLNDKHCFFFSPPPGEAEMKSQKVKPGPCSEQKKKERAVPAALTEEEKNRIQSWR
jgi:hypothetical protein